MCGGSHFGFKNCTPSNFFSRNGRIFSSASPCWGYNYLQKTNLPCKTAHVKCVSCQFSVLGLYFNRTTPHPAALPHPADGAVHSFASGHTAMNTPDPIRTRKLSIARPGQYWGGGPPGKPLRCRWLFPLSFWISYR